MYTRYYNSGIDQAKVYISFNSVVGERGKTAVTGKYMSFSLPSTTTDNSILGIESLYDVRREVVGVVN